MSILGKFASLFRRKASDELDDMRLLGIQVKTDLALASRIQDLQDTLEIVKDPSLDINFRIDYLDSKIMTVAVPFLRAGSNPHNYELVKGWQYLMMFWKRIYTSVDREMKVKISLLEDVVLPDGTEQASEKTFVVDPETAIKLHFQKDAKILEYKEVKPQIKETWSAFTPEETKRHLREIGEMEIIPLGMLVIAASFTDEDVSPNRVIVVQGGSGFLSPTGAAPLHPR